MTAQPMSGRILYSCESQPNRRPASFFVALALIGLSVFAMTIAVLSASGLNDPVYRQYAFISFITGLKYKTLVKKSTSTLNDPRDAEK